MDSVFFDVCFFFMTISSQVKIQTFIFIFISLQSAGSYKMAEATQSYILCMSFKTQKEDTLVSSDGLNSFCCCFIFCSCVSSFPPVVYHSCFSVTLQVKPALCHCHLMR